MPKPAATSMVTTKCVSTAGLDFHTTTVEQEAATSCQKQKVTVGDCQGSDRTRVEIDLRSKPNGHRRCFAKEPLQAARHKEENPVPPHEDVSVTKTASATLNAVESEVIRLINVLRADPGGFADEYIAPRKSKLTGTLLKTKNTWVKTVEGRSAIEEAESVLHALGKEEADSGVDAATRNPVQVTSRGLILAARDLAVDIGAKGLVTHQGTDESTLEDRLLRYTSSQSQVTPPQVITSHPSSRVTSPIPAATLPGRLLCVPSMGVAHEVISFGVSDPAEIVAQLVVDDGVPTRHDRRFLLDPQVKTIGVAFADHRAHGHCCVITLVDNYKDQEDIHDLCKVHAECKKRVSLDSVATVTLPQGGEMVLKKGIDAKGNGVCAACYGEVPERLSTFGLGGQRFHRHCLVCRVCKSSLQASYYVHLADKEEGIGSIYCADCTRFRFPPRCFKCHKKLDSEPLHKSTTNVRSEITGVYGEGLGMLPHCQDCFAEATILVEASCDV